MQMTGFSYLSRQIVTDLQANSLTQIHCHPLTQTSTFKHKYTQGVTRRLNNDNQITHEF